MQLVLIMSKSTISMRNTRRNEHHVESLSKAEFWNKTEQNKLRDRVQIQGKYISVRLRFESISQMLSISKGVCGLGFYCKLNRSLTENQPHDRQFYWH